MSRIRFARLLIPLAALLAVPYTLSGSPQSAPPARPQVFVNTPAARPRLVVLLVVDQFRGDYPQMYGQQWSKGLHRLFSTGADFPLAAYPYGGTVTCAGHSTIGSGSFPLSHGMIGNSWYDPALRRTALCTNDAAVSSIALGDGAGTEHHSPRALLTPSFADELRVQARTPPRVLSVSLKPRSAIGLGGHGGPGSLILWEEDNGTWATSDAFTPTAWPEVADYVRAHPIAASYGQVWNKMLPASAYLFDDDAVGEGSPAPWSRTFPHKIESASGKPDNAFVTNWERSPWSDAYVADMTIALVSKLGLGTRADATDFLSMSFSALDLVGHEYGPRSHEVQDVLARVDVQVGRVLDALDRAVGRGRWVLGFSADHGIAPIPEQSAALGMDAGRVAPAEIQRVTQAAVVAALGPGTYYGGFSDHSIFLVPGTIEKLRAAGAIGAVKTALLQIKGLARAYGPDELGGTTATDDPWLKAWRLSYLAGRSGDFVVVPRPYWIIRGGTTGSTHGTPYAYDAHVPVVLLGAGIKTGQYLVPATPADLAPTLAWLTGITLSRADGRVLIDALARPGR